MSFLEGARDLTLAGVGALLYNAASPDELDGYSQAEFEILKSMGPKVFDLYEKVSRNPNIPQNLALPAGFAVHFETEVIPDLEVIRNDPEKRVEFRSRITELLHDPRAVNKLYRENGQSYSQILSDVAGSDRAGKFYSAKNSEHGGIISALREFDARYDGDASTTGGLRESDRNLIRELNSKYGLSWSWAGWEKVMNEWKKLSVGGTIDSNSVLLRPARNGRSKRQSLKHGGSRTPPIPKGVKK